MALTTNGDAIAKTVFLANGDTAENWREITEEEAEQMRRTQDEAAAKALEQF